MRSKLGGTLAILVAAMMVAACGGSSGGGAGGNVVNNATVTIAVGQDPGNLDPQNSVLVVDGEFAAFGYDPLVNESAKATPISGLAKSWTQTGNTYRFTLQPSITCADGSSLTAKTIAANFNYLANPASKSPLFGLYIPAGLKATGDDTTHTVTLKLTSPFAFFLTGLSAVPIVCQKGLDNRKSLAQATDGTGPYQLSKHVAGDSYTYSLRKNYRWGPGGVTGAAAGLPTSVVLKVVANPSTAANLLLSGQVNIAGVAQADQARVEANHLLHRDLRAPVGEMYFNESAGRPLAEMNVRRALVEAVNLSQLGKVLTGGTGQPSSGMVTVEPKPCQGNPVSGNLPPYDPSAAATLLDQAGWTKGSDGLRHKDGHPLTLQLIYSTGSDDTASAVELAVSQWRAAGIKVNAVAKPDSDLSTVLFSTGAWDISWAPLTVQVPTQLVPLLSGPVPPKGTNFGHLTNADYDRLTKKASAEADTSGCADWNAAEVALLKAVDVVPYYDALGPTFAKGASFDQIGGVLVPTSLRALSR